MSLAQVRAMTPQEWDAWRTYWCFRPRFDPWFAMCRICGVIVAVITGADTTTDNFMPPAPKRVRRRRRKNEAEIADRGIRRMFGL
ncbi:hypothetical protein [Paludisphaera rhizosphaerae]|uniref:hypothetical protein n=1 Tax=Paludisphaera rhizosphaerae TaxID=2711216 RepID=UPI0013ED6154|nr:hypothetical protein [Paludisphaera rhizosphaerae]